MSQVNAGDFPIDPQVTSGTALAEILNRWFNASNTQNSGATEPPTTYPGMFWYDSSTTPPVLKIRNSGNSGWVDFADTLVLEPGNITGLGTMATVNSPVPIANGGTAATTAVNAKANLGLANVTNNRQVIAWNNSTVYIGWDTTLELQVDATWFGNIWPISINGNAGSVSGVSGWNYSNRAKQPVYFWVTDGATNDQYLTTPASITVGSASWATTAGTAGYCSGTSEYANNSGALGGVGYGGYVRSDACWIAGFASQDYNMPYMRIGNEGGGLRYLAWLTNNETTARSFRLTAGNQVMEISGTAGAFACQVTPCDVRLKDNVEASDVDGTTALKQFEFIQFDWKKQEEPAGEVPEGVTKTSIQIGETHTNLSFSAQNLQGIDEQMVIATKQPEDSPMADLGSVLSPNTASILAYVAKALQETIARVDALEQA